MQVKSIAECSKGSILQYFRHSLSYHLSLSSLFRLILSGHFTLKVWLYIKCVRSKRIYMKTGGLAIHCASQVARVAFLLILLYALLIRISNAYSNINKNATRTIWGAQCTPKPPFVIYILYNVLALNLPVHEIIRIERDRQIRPEDHRLTSQGLPSDYNGRDFLFNPHADNGFIFIV